MKIIIYTENLRVKFLFTFGDVFPALALPKLINILLNFNRKLSDNTNSWANNIFPGRKE